MTLNPNWFLNATGQFAPIGSGQINISTTTTTAFLGFLTKATTAAIAIPNGSFVDGPSVSQGSSGVWLVTACVTCLSTGNTNFLLKLHDGTSTYGSGVAANANSASDVHATLSAVASAPAGNLRISIQGVGAAGTLEFNASGLSNDSYITAIRIG